VNPLPAPEVNDSTVLAPTNRSLLLVVTTDPVLLIELFPVAAAAVSTGLTASTPLYSKIRISGIVAGESNVTVTVFVASVGAAMFFA
jgi:hypothetical protein